MLDLGRRVALSSCLLALAAGCGSDDTIVALNVGIQRDLAGLATLDVTITQAGQSPVTATISPPTDPLDGGGSKVRAAFFERITLPESWTDASADIVVVAKSTVGSTLAEARTTTEINDDGVVAAQVNFPAEPTTGTDDDAGVQDE